uniref:uncharacterized protein LOC122580136 n=1 Tax=Erigeron canadensis TaxID=72917 RepID=UPI001CB935D2|nr:uncharacterized protein LOC122580136 [Erigeron canadensis]XP_043608342.1 uncharacterized protein LOC122580136 [Erigeron canadensis]
MGTKRAFDEDLQEFIKHPKHISYGSNPASAAESKLFLETFQVAGIGGESGRKYFGADREYDIFVPDIAFKDIEIKAPLPLVTGMDTGDDDDVGPGPVFPTNPFSEYFEYKFPTRQLYHHEDIYSSLFNSSPRKVVPVGPDNQAGVPEFNTELAKSYKDNGGMEHFMGVCVIPAGHPIYDSDIKKSCKCLDGGSIRCVQQHVKEARLNLRQFYGDEKFADMGMLDMGEEVADGWTEEEEQLFHEVVYSNPASIGNMFWKQLSVAFPFRTKKELVSYYFNVFILRRRAVQNRSYFLDIDSDDDEWRESYGGSFGDQVEDDDSVLGDHDEDGGNYYDNNGGGELDVVTGIKGQSLEPNSAGELDVDPSVVMNENKVTIED